MATFLADMCGINAFTTSNLEESIFIRIDLNSRSVAAIVEAAAGRGGHIHPVKGG